MNDCVSAFTDLAGLILQFISTVILGVAGWWITRGQLQLQKRELALKLLPERLTIRDKIQEMFFKAGAIAVVEDYRTLSRDFGDLKPRIQSFFGPDVNSLSLEVSEHLFQAVLTAQTLHDETGKSIMKAGEQRNEAIKRRDDHLRRATSCMPEMIDKMMMYLEFHDR
ncbi:hypothetical protein SAMN02745166_04930 [Prosthecobacter debontii]|uniref:Uncharacterized protein n=1 Tax=Prosthecobacter debontii TaxID=48467 RepID=A0A1T4Z4A4_9BACT|nr:hypothetical protein [Prosthecobacter debontii]SKB08401.1 hypothetical protein SAMN02745166_04930 [Prosthecobacter debontii]